MATAEQHLAPLSAAERQQLESWLTDFSRVWDEGLLARRAQELPPGDRLRVAALIEMVKIDLERRWQGGRQALLEHYLRTYPELTAADGAVAVLLRAEYAARSRVGAPPTSAELLRRFPNLAGVIRQLTAWPAGSASGAPRPAPPTRETMHSAASTPSVAPRSAAGRSLPEQFGARYHIIKKLGRGGMGTVYLARDTQLDRPVALKVPHFTPEDGPEGLQRFYQEARIAATLDHPNICPIYDVGEVGGVPYLTMKCVVGKPLTDYVRPDRPLPQPQAAALVRKVALALAAAHERGIVHRDLKPSNIMIHRGGEPMVMDFGLAGRPHREGSARLTRSGTPLGTPAYMAPEQARGDTRELGPACDVYSLGVVLYELLTGRPPFEGPVFAVLAMVLTQEPTPPAQLRPDLDPRLAAVCRKAMAKKAEDRYASMGAFVEALESYLRQRDRPAPIRRLPYLPALIGAAGGLLVVLLVVVGVLLSLARRTPAAKTEREAPVAAAPVAAPPTTAPAPPAPPSTAAAPVVKPADPPAPARPKPAAAELALETCLPDDTVIVLTVNVRQVLDSAVVRKYLGPRLDKLLKANLLLAAAWNAANFDPLKDVATLRMAFTDVSTPNVKMLVLSQGHFDRARLEAMWAAGGKLHEVPDGAGGSFRVYEMADGPQGQTMYYAFLGESAFAVGMDIGLVTEALAKQAGRRQTALKDATLRRLLSRVDERASVCLAVTGGLKNDHGQTLREASGCESFVASLTLADDLRGQVTCAVANRAAAEKLNGDITAELVKASVQLTLEAEKNPELAPLLDVLKSIKGTVDDNAVTIRGRVPAAVLDRVLAGKEVDEVFQKAAEELTRLQGPAQEVRQAVQFNDALVEAQRKVGDAADKVHKALQGLGAADGVAGAKKAAAAFRKTYDEVQAQLRRLQPPLGKSTQAFQDALQRLLQEQARVVDEDMAKLRSLEAAGMKPDVMMLELEEYHARKARSVGAAMQTFVGAQKVFARDHNITLR